MIMLCGYECSAINKPDLQQIDALDQWCQSINMVFVGRCYTTRPRVPTTVSGKHDQKVHAGVVF